MSTKIIACLQHQLTSKNIDSRFISWCHKCFSLEKIGLKCLLSDSKNHKPILVYEEMFEVYKEIHINFAHAGRDKCLEYLSINYSWYNREILQLLLKNCASCQRRKPIHKPMLSKPIVALGMVYCYSSYHFYNVKIIP